MSQAGATKASLDSSQSAGTTTTSGSESGSRRRKLAGYMKAANELRHAYQQSSGSQWGSKGTQPDDAGGSTVEGFPDAAIVRSGDEEMILFPSYARRHVKSKPESVPGTIQETPGSGDVRDSGGTGDAEFWKQQWEAYEDDKAIVDVDVRGWVYTQHKGPMSRKQRLFIGLARQLIGIPAPPSDKTSPTPSAAGSRSTSPVGSLKERADARASMDEQKIIAKEAESIVQRGEAEAAVARRGGYSEVSPDNDGQAKIDGNVSPVLKRPSWNQPSSLSSAELSTANAHLMARLKPFLANPLVDAPISAFFYNDTVSRQRTVNTDAWGQFSVRAALDFIPTHVRILASEKLSATAEVQITEPKGVSLISDIDDTIKHSAIGAGAREIFRNTFIRDLGDLTIEGVKEWYKRLADLGVKIHYVSNSPWQLYPVLKSFFSLAGLPPGSFHLKQYSGMLQGIFEPVAERKKSTLDKLMHDFPERRFLLVGDSGEADLEVYTDVVVDNPGRILGVFIRDVTTSVTKGFFDSAMGSLTGDRRGKENSVKENTSGSSPTPHPSSGTEDEDVKAAIAASIRDLEGAEKKENTASAPNSQALSKSNGFAALSQNRALPGRTTDAPAPDVQGVHPPMEDLIDLSDEVVDTGPKAESRSTDSDSKSLSHQPTGPSASGKSKPPVKPAKPPALRTTSTSATEVPSKSSTAARSATAPPEPLKPSASAVSAQSLEPNSSLKAQHPSDPPNASKPPEQGYRASARQALSSVYNHIPSPSALWASMPSDSSTAQTENATGSPREPNTSADTKFETQAPPVPPRRNISSYPAAAAQYASSRVTGYWRDANADGIDDGQVITKKEELWKRRWERAQRIMNEHGVELRSWRVGSDALDDAVRLVEKGLKEQETK